MKLFRTPNFKKKLTDRIAVKKQVVNRCGLKMKNGWGWMRDPKKFVDNKVRNKYVVSPEKFVIKQLKNAVKSVSEPKIKTETEILLEEVGIVRTEEEQAEINEIKKEMEAEEASKGFFSRLFS